MKTWNVLLIAVGIVFLLSLLTVWFVPSAQDFMVSNTLWNGVRRFLKAGNVGSINSLDLLPASPKNSALIAVPYLEYSDVELAQLKKFVADGGTLLLMDDYGFGNQVLKAFDMKMRFDGRPLLDPLFCYKNPWLPKITDFISPVALSGIQLVVLDHATVLQQVADADILARSHSTSFIDTNENGKQGKNEPGASYPVAAAREMGKGKLVVVSDPSIMINSMMSDNDNYKFIMTLLSLDGKPKDIVLETSHLSQTPLDVSKVRLTDARELLSEPYPLLAVVGFVFVSVSGLLLRTGGTIGRHS